MSIYAGKIPFPFEPKMSVALDSVAETKTPEVLRPTLGTLAAIRYKPAKLAFNLIMSAAPTTGAVTIRLYAGGEEIASASAGIVGKTVVGAKLDVDLAEVAGQTELAVAVDVTSAADSGITATLDSRLDVELPIVQSGC